MNNVNKKTPLKRVEEYGGKTSRRGGILQNVTK